MNYVSVIFGWGLWTAIYAFVLLAVVSHTQPAYVQLWKPWAKAVLWACQWGLRLGAVIMGVAAGMWCWPA